MNRPAHVPEDLVVEFGYFGSEQIDEAHAKVRRWRTEKGSVVWSDLHGGHGARAEPRSPSR